jgi:MFS family permease
MTYRHKVAIVFLLGFFLDLINMFIASVAFPAMAVELNSSAPALAWISNGYIAGMTLVIPFSALITRRIGAKRLFILSLTLFCAAASAAGLAESLSHLIFWRVLQGAGGGLLIPVGQALAWQQFKPHERAGLSTAVMLVALLAPASAPALGGVLIQFFSWRWIFFAPLPLAVVTLLLACLWLKNDTTASGPARLLHLPLLSDPLLRERGRPVLSAECGKDDPGGNGCADAPLVARLVYRHFHHRQIFQPSWPTPVDNHRLSVAGGGNRGFISGISDNT